MEKNEQYYIETYGLKSGRRKERLKRWGHDKDLLRLENEYRKLDKMNRELGLIELEKPIQRGWKRFYVLREDVAKSNEAKFYQSILDKINTGKICKRKDFLYKSYRTKKLYPVEQHTKRLCRSDFEKLNFSDKQKELFEYKWIRDNAESQKYRAFVYLCEWQFEFRISKNIITHLPVFDSVLEAKIAELEKRVYGFQNQNRLATLHGRGTYKNRWNEFTEKEKLIKRWVNSHVKEEMMERNFTKEY